MKVSPVSITVNDLRCKDRTCLLSILQFDGENCDNSLFEIGLFYGKPRFEILYHHMVFWGIINFIDEKFGNDPTTAIIRSLRNFLRKFV